MYWNIENYGDINVRWAGFNDYRMICALHRDYDLVGVGYAIAKKYAKDDFLAGCDCEQNTIEDFFELRNDILLSMSVAKMAIQQECKKSTREKEIVNSLLSQINKADEAIIEVYNRIQDEKGMELYRSDRIKSSIEEFFETFKEKDFEIMLESAIELELLQMIGPIKVISVAGCSSEKDFERLNDELRSLEYPAYLDVYECSWPRKTLDFNEFPKVKYVKLYNYKFEKIISNKKNGKQYADMMRGQSNVNELVSVDDKKFIPVKNQYLRNLLKKVM